MLTTLSWHLCIALGKFFSISVMISVLLLSPGMNKLSYVYELSVHDTGRYLTKCLLCGFSSDTTRYLPIESLRIGLISWLCRKRHEKLEVRIVDLDSIGEDGACKFPFFLNPEIQWPQEVRGGEAVTKGLDVKIFRRTFKAEQARRQGGQKAYLPVRAMYSPDISQNMLQTRPILFCRWTQWSLSII